jgi:hypothetical protein
MADGAANLDAWTPAGHYGISLARVNPDRPLQAMDTIPKPLRVAVALQNLMREMKKVKGTLWPGGDPGVLDALSTTLETVTRATYPQVIAR